MHPCTLSQTISDAMILVLFVYNSFLHSITLLPSFLVSSYSVLFYLFNLVSFYFKRAMFSSSLWVCLLGVSLSEGSLILPIFPISIFSPTHVVLFVCWFV